MKNKIKCPLCGGCGKIEDPSFTNKEAYIKLKIAAHKLRQEGKTLRQIAEVLGYNGPQSIVHLLKRRGHG